VRYVELSCARDALLRRVLDPSCGAYDKVRDAQTLERWLDEGRIRAPQIERPGVLRIDTTLLGPAETARQVAGHYRLPILTA
jgi:hypothetical protein